MKSTGIVRKIDELGRVVLPIELRKKLNLEVKDPIEIFVSNDKIVLKKYEESDIFTGETQDLVEYNGKKISKKTIFELAKLVGLNLNKNPLDEFEEFDNIDIDEFDS